MEGDLIKPLLLNRIDDYPLSGLGRITTATNQDVHVLINGDYTYTFDMIVTDKLFSKVKEEMIVSTSVSPTSTDFFYVKNIGVKNPGTVTVTCNHITMQTNENFVRGKFTIDGKSVKDIISEMSSRLDIKQNFSYSTDIDKTIGTTEITYTNENPGQILVGDTNSLVSVLDARLVRKGMTLKLTNKSTGRYIDLRRGKNIAGVSINRSIDNLVTSIVPYYTLKPVETVDNSTDSTNANNWTIKNVTGNVTVGSNDAQLYDDSNQLIDGRELKAGTVWIASKQRTKDGTTQYKVATGEWVNSSDVSFLGSVGDVTNGTSTLPVNSDGWTVKRVISGVVTVTSNMALLSDDNNNVGGNRALAKGSQWSTSQIRTKSGSTQYKVATNQWVNSSDVSFSGSIGSIISQPAQPTVMAMSLSVSDSTDGWTYKKVTDGVITIGTNGYIYNDQGIKEQNRVLANGGSYKTDRVRINGSNKQYRVGIDMWLSDNGNSMTGTIADTVSTPGQSTTNLAGDYGWTIRDITNGVVTTGNSGARIYGNDNTMVLNRKLGPNTPWKTDKQRNKNGVYQYRVATNMWVLSSDVSFKGDLGKENAGSTSPVTPSDTNKEEQLQYGPEVYSPLVGDYKGPHRKYVDYSSRVDNMADLIDVSSKYFIENPSIDKPTYTIDVDVAKANQKRVVNAEVGDIARIYDPKYGITSDETIIERHFDPDLGINKSLKAGTFQQTIFRYLDKRIKDATQQTKDVKTQADSNISNVQNNIDSVTNDMAEVKDNQVAAKDETDQKIDKAQQESKSFIDKVKQDVASANSTISNLMNSGGNNKIQWIPNFANATQLKIITPYGYWLLDDHGAGFHNNNGTVMDGLAADGHVWADSITGNALTGTTITGGTINGGVINAPVINNASIKTTQSIQLMGSSGQYASTSVASYGISTPRITVDYLDGVQGISTQSINVLGTGTIKYLHIASGGNISSDGGGLYIQGPVYVDGRQI